MNREQKLALIIGFAVILVVGVLVSDHLSAAQQVRLADATEGDLGRVEARPVAMLPDPSAGVRTASADTAPTMRQEPVLEAEEQATSDDVLRIVQGGTTPFGDAIRFDDQRGSRLDGAGQAIRDFGQTLADRFREGGAPVAANLEEGTARPEVEPIRDQPRVREVPEPTRVTHTVAKNENLYKIAARYLGDGNRWREIAKANEGKVSADGGVRSGVTLVIPGATAPAPTRTAPQRRPEPTTYTVAKNDSLGEIAQKLMGSVRYMDEIIAANPGKIDDPDDIRVGMVLNIPTRS